MKVHLLNFTRYNFSDEIVKEHCDGASDVAQNRQNKLLHRLDGISKFQNSIQKE